MPSPNRANEAIAENGLCAYFGRKVPKHTNIKVNLPIAESSGIFVRFWREADARARRL